MSQDFVYQQDVKLLQRWVNSTVIIVHPRNLTQTRLERKLPFQNHPCKIARVEVTRIDAQYNRVAEYTGQNLYKETANSSILVAVVCAPSKK